MIFETLFWLIAFHFIADFQLQSDYVATNKIPGSNPAWSLVMTSHAAVHGVAVAYILNPLYGAAEFVTHWLIDTAKSTGIISECATKSLWIDQSLHIGLKIIWLWLFFAFA